MSLSDSTPPPAAGMTVAAADLVSGDDDLLKVAVRHGYGALTERRSGPRASGPSTAPGPGPTYAAPVVRSGHNHSSGSA